MTYRPTESLARRLRDQAANEHLSMQALLSKAAEEYLDRHAKKAIIARSVAETKVEFADSMRRLGELVSDPDVAEQLAAFYEAGRRPAP